MKHCKRITVAKAEAKQFDDPIGAVFLQVWLGVITFIITGAIGDK